MGFRSSLAEGNGWLFLRTMTPKRICRLAKLPVQAAPWCFRADFHQDIRLTVNGLLDSLNA